jgi:hypothetical protein
MAIPSEASGLDYTILRPTGLMGEDEVDPPLCDTHGDIQ